MSVDHLHLVISTLFIVAWILIAQLIVSRHATADSEAIRRKP